MSKSIQNYSTSVLQTDTTHYLMITLFYLSNSKGIYTPKPEQTKLEAIITKLQQAKNSLSESVKYLQLVEESTGVFSLGSLDKRQYRVSEVYEQILGKVIKLKDSMSTPGHSTMFSLGSDNFYYVIMNCANILLPRLKVIQDVMYQDIMNTANSDIVATSIVVSLIVFVAITIVSMLLFVRQSLKLRITLMASFMYIPDSIVKLYHAQTEYYVLLFSGMQDKHVDDLKTEVNALRKTNDKASGGSQLHYGKKNKRLIDRGMMQTRTYVLVGSLIVSVLAYCGALLYINYFKSSRLNKTVPFLYLEKQRTLSYVKILNSMYMTSIDNSIFIGSKSIIDIARDDLEALYKIDSLFAIVLYFDSQDYYSHKPDIGIYSQTYNIVNSQGGACVYAMNKSKCTAAIGIFYNQVIKSESRDSIIY